MLNDPTFYLAISFAIFGIFVGRPLARHLIAFLDQRRASIQNLIRVATEKKEEAEKFLELSQGHQNEIASQISSIKQHAQFESERVKSEARKKVEETILREEMLITEQIERAEGRAIADIKRSAIDVAILGAKKILEEGVDAQTNERLIDQALDHVETLSIKFNTQ